MLYSFCFQYFRDKDTDFVANHKVVDLLSDDVLSLWCDNLMDESKIPLAFLRTLMEYNVIENLERWEKFIRLGNDISSSYSLLRPALSSEIKKKSEVVRSLLDACKEREISLNDIFWSFKNFHFCSPC